MLLSEVVEEITEKEPNYLSVPSIIRKINQVRNRLIRIHSKDITPATMDLQANLAEYPLPCSQNDVRDVVVNGVQYPNDQLGTNSRSRFYYFLEKTIGIYPTPTVDVSQGLMIFHTKTLRALTTTDMGNEVGLEPDYDMLLVYGVLKDITNSPKVNYYNEQYNELLRDLQSANTGWDCYVVNERW